MSSSSVVPNSEMKSDVSPVNHDQEKKTVPPSQPTHQVIEVKESTLSLVTQKDAKFHSRLVPPNNKQVALIPIKALRVRQNGKENLWTDKFWQVAVRAIDDITTDPVEKNGSYELLHLLLGAGREWVRTETSLISQKEDVVVRPNGGYGLEKNLSQLLPKSIYDSLKSLNNFLNNCVNESRIFFQYFQLLSNEKFKALKKMELEKAIADKNREHQIAMDDDGTVMSKLSLSEEKKEEKEKTREARKVAKEKEDKLFQELMYLKMNLRDFEKNLAKAKDQCLDEEKAFRSLISSYFDHESKNDKGLIDYLENGPRKEEYKLLKLRIEGYRRELKKIQEQDKTIVIREEDAKEIIYPAIKVRREIDFALNQGVDKCIQQYENLWNALTGNVQKNNLLESKEIVERFSGRDKVMASFKEELNKLKEELLPRFDKSIEDCKTLEFTNEHWVFFLENLRKEFNLILTPPSDPISLHAEERKQDGIHLFRKLAADTLEKIWIADACKEYKFELMTKEAELQPKTIYLSKTENAEHANQIIYSVIKPDGKPVTVTTYLEAPNPFSLAKLELLKDDILKDASPYIDSKRLFYYIEYVAKLLGGARKDAPSENRIEAIIDNLLYGDIGNLCFDAVRDKATDATLLHHAMACYYWVLIDKNVTNKPIRLHRLSNIIIFFLNRGIDYTAEDKDKMTPRQHAEKEAKRKVEVDSLVILDWIEASIKATPFYSLLAQEFRLLLMDYISAARITLTSFGNFIESWLIRNNEIPALERCLAFMYEHTAHLSDRGIEAIVKGMLKDKNLPSGLLINNDARLRTRLKGLEEKLENGEHFLQTVKIFRELFKPTIGQCIQDSNIKNPAVVPALRALIRVLDHPFKNTREESIRVIEKVESLKSELPPYVLIEKYWEEQKKLFWDELRELKESFKKDKLIPALLLDRWEIKQSADLEKKDREIERAQQAKKEADEKAAKAEQDRQREAQARQKAEQDKRELGEKAAKAEQAKRESDEKIAKSEQARREVEEKLRRSEALVKQLQAAQAGQGQSAVPVTTVTVTLTPPTPSPAPQSLPPVSLATKGFYAPSAAPAVARREEVVVRSSEKKEPLSKRAFN